jgi:hypothetical protein
MKRYLETFIIGVLVVLVLALVSVAKDVQARADVVNQTVPTVSAASNAANITVAASTNTTSSAPQASTLLEYANELGINVSNITLKYTDSATPPPNSDLPATKQATGMFNPNTNTITILDDQSTLEGGSESQDEIATVAYEYMHYVWMYDLSDNEQTAQGQALQKYNQDNVYFHSLVKAYIGDQDTLDNEYAATACTEIQPIELSSAFNDWCNHYIPNREAVLF